MKIALCKIKPSAQPIRSSWDEEKMEELAQSIREQGLIVPVKVRPVAEWAENCAGMKNDPFPMMCVSLREMMFDEYGTSGMENAPPMCPWCEYALEAEQYSPDELDDLEEENGIPHAWKPFELVYGHRRAEAARRADLTEIECVVEGLDDTTTLIQALIENVQREDLNQLDQAKAIQALKLKTGWNNSELDRKGIVTFHRASELLAILDQTPQVQRFVADESIGEYHVRSTRPLATPMDKERVLEKASKEGLTAQQTRQVAESVAAAKSDARREFLLNAQYSPYIHDPENVLRREERYGDHDRQITGPPKPSSDSEWEKLPQVRDIIKIVNVWRNDYHEIRQMVDAGKLTPEAQQYLANRMKPFVQELSAFVAQMEGAINER